MADIYRPPPADYLHLSAGTDLVQVDDGSPFIALVIIEQIVDDAWQDQVSEWLVASGCHYMCAWGLNASSWDDSVDWASRRLDGTDELAHDKWVITTWHDHETLTEVFWYAGHCAQHPTLDLRRVLIVDISAEARRDEILGRYVEAQSLPAQD